MLWLRDGPTAEKSLSDWSPESPGNGVKAGDWCTPCCSVGEGEGQEEMSSSKTSADRGKDAQPEERKSERR